MGKKNKQVAKINKFKQLRYYFNKRKLNKQNAYKRADKTKE